MEEPYLKLKIILKVLLKVVKVEGFSAKSHLLMSPKRKSRVMFLVKVMQLLKAFCSIVSMHRVKTGFSVKSHLLVSPKRKSRVMFLVKVMQLLKAFCSIVSMHRVKTGLSVKSHLLAIVSPKRKSRVMFLVKVMQLLRAFCSIVSMHRVKTEDPPEKLKVKVKIKRCNSLNYHYLCAPREVQKFLVKLFYGSLIIICEAVAESFMFYTHMCLR